ncbi:MAG: glycosyltransferase, partial [Acidimicrobiia bacterium]
MTARVIVSGALAAKPGNGGEAWVRMNWVLGLAELGHDVIFVEQLPAAACTGDAHRWFGKVTRSFGLRG